MACSNITQQNTVPVTEAKKTLPTYAPMDTTTHPMLGPRYSITGDFNGDGVTDTLSESYIDPATHRETYKVFDTLNWDNNQYHIWKNKHSSLLCSNILNTDTFTVSTDLQQAGVFLLNNLGDLNGDKADEIGYIANWADFSNLNTYLIISLSGKRFKEIFSFQINELSVEEPSYTFDNGLLVKKLSAKKFQYKFYSKNSEIETGIHTFK